MKPVIRLLTVDAAGTLIRPWPSVGTVYAQTAREHGIIAEDKEIDRRFYKVFGNIQKNQSITLGEEKDFWKTVVLKTFQPFAKPIEIEPVFEKLWDLFAQGDHWRLSENAETTLQALKDRGYRIALLSNNDSRLRNVIQDLGIASIFEQIFISSEIGFEKPNPKIFKYVEREMSASAEEILHLGDSYSGGILRGQKALVGLPCYLESLKLKKIKSLIFKNFFPFCRDSSQKKHTTFKTCLTGS